MSVNNTLVSNQFVYLFRGDLRSMEEVFAHGFEARELNTPIKKNVELGIVSKTAVCMTPIFDIAAIFPFKSDGTSQNLDVPSLRHFPKVTNIYLLKVPISELYYTYHDQIDKDFNIAYAQEVAVKQVLPKNIIGAIPVKRFFYTYSKSDFIYKKIEHTDFACGGEYRLMQPTMTFNPNNDENIDPNIRADMDALIQKRINVAVKIPSPIDLDYRVRGIYTLTNQPFTKTLSLEEHKEHKRFTYAAVLLKKFTQAPSPQKLLIAQKIQQKTNGQYWKCFPSIGHIKLEILPTGGHFINPQPMYTNLRYIDYQLSQEKSGFSPLHKVEILT